MTKVREEHIEITKDLKKHLSEIHFIDTFSTTNHTNTIEEISNLIFNTPPKWITILFKIRNRIITGIGLKSEIPTTDNEKNKSKNPVSSFKNFYTSENEIVIGANDSHLDFRAVIRNNKADRFNIKIITLVKYNNTMGKVYMFIIKPFHKMVVKRMVRNAFV